MFLDLTEEQKLIQDTARDFAKAELEPVAAKLDREDDRPAFLANLKKLAELGFMGLNVKEQLRRLRGRGRRLQRGHDRDRPGLRLDGGDGFGQQHGLRGDPGGRHGRTEAARTSRRSAPASIAAGEFCPDRNRRRFRSLRG